jgi:hypothetical protein
MLVLGGGDGCLVPTFSLIILVFDGKRAEFIEGKTSLKPLSPASAILLSDTAANARLFALKSFLC